MFRQDPLAQIRDTLQKKTFQRNFFFLFIDFEKKMLTIFLSFNSEVWRELNSWSDEKWKKKLKIQSGFCIS